MRRFLLSFLLIFAVVFPASSQPVLFDYYDPENCKFPIPNARYAQPPVVIIPSLGGSMPKTEGDSNRTTGQVAVRIKDKWVVREARLTLRHDRLEVVCHLDMRDFVSEPIAHPDALAYPIDSRLKRSDIEGATIIRPNADNTAWLFFHAEAEDHYDRELAIQAAIVGAFQRTLDDANLDIIRHRKNAAVQNAKILAYGRLIEFRNDWIGYALIAEQRKYIGHHIQDTTYVHECVIDTFNDAIKEWKKNKADAWTPISYHVETVAKRRITTLHDYDEPWNHPTRRVIENLKKKATEAEAAESESSGE